MKIGIIQNEAPAGDLSRNLRLVVQGYRKCLDDGAEFVIAPAQALDGAFLCDLATRSSFQLQAQAALQALANETSRPLLLASWAAEPGEEAQLRPWLLQQGRVRRVRNRGILRLGSARLFIDAGERPVPAQQKCDYVVHLPTERWWLGQTEAWQQQMQQEAKESAAHVLLAQALSYNEGKLLPGGSMAAAASGEFLQLPLFEAAARVYPSGARAKGDKPAQTSSLFKAISYGLQHALTQGGYEACAVPAQTPHAALLLALSRLAVGARRTILLAPHAEQQPFCKLAGKSLSLPPGCAEEHDLLALNGASLSHTDLATAQGGAFAPFGELYDDELELLRAEAIAKLPEKWRATLPPLPTMSPEEAAELYLLVEENASPIEIQARCPGADEARLRRRLRCLAAARRICRPCSLHLRRRLTRLPAYHGLKE